MKHLCKAERTTSMDYMYKYGCTSNHKNGVDLDTKGSQVAGR